MQIFSDFSVIYGNFVPSNEVGLHVLQILHRLRMDVPFVNNFINALSVV
jgi:hypothetical protein